MAGGSVSGAGGEPPQMEASVRRDDYLDHECVRRLARDLDVAESEVRRMLNPDHATKSAAIDRALRRLGKRVSVTVGEAA